MLLIKTVVREDAKPIPCLNGQDRAGTISDSSIPIMTMMIFDKEKEKYWMPVDLYIGGAEHAVLHLLYSRFWHKVLFDLGIVSTDEPYRRLFNQGMILAFAYENEAGAKIPADQIEEREGKFYNT